MKEKNSPFVFSVPEIIKAGTYEASPEIGPGEFADAFPGRNIIRSVSVSLVFVSAGEDIVLNGKAKASLALECSRCGADVIKEFSEDFDECFNNSVEYINVRENIREAIALMEPMKVLCSEKCKGRCPQCGADLNREQCSCKRETASPFEVLRNFKPKG